MRSSREEIVTNVLITALAWAGLALALRRFCRPHLRRILQVEQLRAQLLHLDLALSGGRASQ